MKAKEAPEKLYLLPNGLISYCRNTDENIEYIRKDTFVEKTEEYMYRQLNEGHMECDDIETFLEKLEEFLDSTKVVQLMSNHE